MSGPEQLSLIGELRPSGPGPTDVARAFDPARLTQARRLIGVTKTALAADLGVSAAAVGQYEAGTSTPRPDLMPRLADVLQVPMAFLAAGRPHARLDASTAHFRSLRSTRVGQRAKAIAFVEQVWELTYALEKRIRLPAVDLPGFAAGEVERTGFPTDPVAAAAALRQRWGLGADPIKHMVRTIETRGVVTTLIAFAGSETARVDAFSTSRLPRPVIVMTPDRADDVYRHRFTAAHELGHLLLHEDTEPGDVEQEHQADAFAAALLAPAEAILPELGTRVDFHALAETGKRWGVSVKALVYRSRELGLLSDATARRAYQRFHQLREVGFFPNEPVTGYPGEIPRLLSTAFALAESEGLSLVDLARELAWPLPRLRQLLEDPDARPALRLA